jgi:hypothetical protein
MQIPEWFYHNLQKQRQVLIIPLHRHPGVINRGRGTNPWCGGGMLSLVVYKGVSNVHQPGPASLKYS